jgi:cathepsin B
MQFTAAFIAAFIGLTSATKVEVADHTTPLDLSRIAAQVNAMGTTWKAAVNPRFVNMTIADAKRELGTILPHEEGYIAPQLERTTFGATEIPTSFDARNAWPACNSVIGNVRDQSSCGSCWAFSGVEAFNDRYCIAHGTTQLFSPEDTVACCTGLVCSFSLGCNGGQPAGAWNWFVKNGVSSGGDYGSIGSGSTCKPYSLMSCAHHVAPPPGMVGCDTIPSYKTPACTNTCSESNYGTAYSKDKYFAKSSYSIKGVENIQREIMEKGPISVALSVYEDFEAYSTGIYKHVSGKYLGGHAIKMIGWGEENGTPYWICTNSWNDSWGEKGTFRILRGKDECGIESSCVAGDV